MRCRVEHEGVCPDGETGETIWSGRGHPFIGQQAITDHSVKLILSGFGNLVKILLHIG